MRTDRVAVDYKQLVPCCTHQMPQACTLACAERNSICRWLWHIDRSPTGISADSHLAQSVRKLLRLLVRQRPVPAWDEGQGTRAAVGSLLLQITCVGRGGSQIACASGRAVCCARASSAVCLRVCVLTQNICR